MKNTDKLGEILNVVISNPKTFLCFPASAADGNAANPNGVKTLLANDLSTFLIKGQPTAINGPRSLPRNPPNCTILEAWSLDNFLLADEWFQMLYRAFLQNIACQLIIYVEN